MGDIEQRAGASAPATLADHEAVAGRLAEKKAAIERDLESAAGHIADIKHERLYKATHSTWDAFCRDYLQMSGRRADQIISNGELGTIVRTFGAPPPANEGQARALGPLRDDPEAMAEVMVEVTASDDPVTAKAISDAVNRKLQGLNDMASELDAAREEVGRLNAMAPNDFDPALNSRLISERGRLVRVCNELLGMGDPAELFDRQREQLRDSHRTAVRDAATWLTFLNKLMEDK